MAENQDGQEKTENATSKRKSETRNKGQVAKSTDVTTASVLLIGGSAVFLMGGGILSSYKDFSKEIFGNLEKVNLTEITFPLLFNEVLGFIAMIVLPIMLLVMTVAITSEISQIGFHFASQKFTKGLNFKKIFNPFPGMKRIFSSKHTLFELAKNFTKVLILGIVVWTALSKKQELILSLAEKPFADVGMVMSSIALEILLKLCTVYVIIAFADYKYQKWKFREDLKMTKTEVKEEAKQSEGDPKIKAQLRRLMTMRIRTLMLKNVKSADVVITNPTHYAVAIKYQQGLMSAPRVIAKGMDFLALKIREIATENNIPIVEEPPLARALYKHCELEQEIPENLFKAVAQVLAYIYALKSKKISRYS
jgi:flagellar biosynthetic protein FlhB